MFDNPIEIKAIYSQDDISLSRGLRGCLSLTYQLSMGDTSVFFDACIKRIEEEIIPLVQTFPPKITKDSDGILSGSVDLLLFRNLLFSLEFCFHETDSRLSDEQLCKIQSIVRKQIIPSYLEFFRNNFLLETGQSSSFFYVRQENNSSWAKVHVVYSSIL